MNESFEKPDQNNEQKKGVSRRDFIKRLVVGSIGAGVVLSSTLHKETDTQKSKIEPIATPFEFIPDKITLSRIKEDIFNKEYREISFVVEFQIKNQEPINAFFSFGEKIGDKKDLKNKNKIIEGKKFHQTLQEVDPKDISVILTSEKVSKILLKEKIIWPFHEN